MGQFSPVHILLLVIIALVFFGPSRLPGLGQSLGKAIRGFKEGLSEIDVDSKDIQDNLQVKHQNAQSQKTTQKEEQNTPS